MKGSSFSYEMRCTAISILNTADEKMYNSVGLCAIRRDIHATLHMFYMALEQSKKYLTDWYHICAQTLAQMPQELTSRQWAILMHVYLMEGDHTVRSLAYTFDISKPSVCRALDTLSHYGLLKRRKDANDGRSILVQKTLKGIAFLNQFSDILEQYYVGKPSQVDVKTAHITLHSPVK
jgi:DNA-binding MarR family transcriptional regulator